MSIKVGDLVMIVRPKTCCHNYKLGIPRTVIAFALSEYQCFHCRHEHPTAFLAQLDNQDWVLVSRLKKIDPPELPESLEREKELSV
jgi:hypothetical protein